MEALKRNHFEFFSLPVSFAIDQARLEDAYRRVQVSVHPDKFANAGQAEKRYAMQLATQANEAYQTLRTPLTRARYLCELHGTDIGAENNTAMPAEFLMQQMQWREALDDISVAQDASAHQALNDEVLREVADVRQQLAAALDVDADYHKAAALVRRLMFLDKFGEELDLIRRKLQRPDAKTAAQTTGV